MYIRSCSSWTKHIDFMLVDLVCLNAAYLLAYYLRFHTDTGDWLFPSPYRLFMLSINIIEIMSCLICSNLSDVLRRGKFVELSKVVQLSAVTLLVTICCMYLAHNSGAYSRLLIAYTFLFFATLDYVARLLYKTVLLRRIRNRSGFNPGSRSAFIVTEEQYADEIISELEAGLLEHFDIHGLCFLGERKNTEELYKGKTLFSDTDAAAKFICREWIDEVFLYVPNNALFPRDFVDRCKEMGVTLHARLELDDVEHSKQFIESIGNRTVLTTAYNYITPHQAFMKRAMDIVGGIVGSLLAIVIAIFIGPIIYINSPGPILFKQKRIGKNGRTFWVYKFRSMYLDAEDRKQGLMTENRVSDGMMFKLDFDPRIIGNKVLPDGTKKTGIGEFIRRTSFDGYIIGTTPKTLAA